MREKTNAPTGVQDLCRRLKTQLEDLALTLNTNPRTREDAERREKLMKQLKLQLAELST